MANSVISLSNGKKVAVQFDYDEKMMSHLNNAPSEPHIETKVKIVVRKGAKVLGTVEASSYCSPEDKFNLTHGRKLAVQRAFAKAGYESPKQRGSHPDRPRAHRRPESEVSQRPEGTTEPNQEVTPIFIPSPRFYLVSG